MCREISEDFEIQSAHRTAASPVDQRRIWLSNARIRAPRKLVRPAKPPSSSLTGQGQSGKEAITVFRDTLAKIFFDEEHSGEEEREIIIGHSVRNRLLLVCFTEREQEVIRIISARQATHRERKDYEESAGI